MQLHNSNKKKDILHLLFSVKDGCSEDIRVSVCGNVSQDRDTTSGGLQESYGRHKGDVE